MPATKLQSFVKISTPGEKALAKCKSSLEFGGEDILHHDKFIRAVVRACAECALKLGNVCKAQVLKKGRSLENG